MLEGKHLAAGYPGCPVFSDLNLSIPDGKLTVIAGPNGCGKSTLLKAMAGILPSQGEVLLGNEEISALSPQLRARKIAYLPQSRQVPEITAERLVLHGRFPYLRYPRRYRPQDLAMAREAMAQLGILDLAQRSLATLSGGQRQKVYIAMVLAQDTPVVLLDEPTTYLDIQHQMQLLRLARVLTQKGKTVVLVLHDLAMALEYADHLIVLSQGTLAAQGTGEAVFSSRCLSAIFGVEIKRLETDNGWKYYYDMGSPGDETMGNNI